MTEMPDIVSAHAAIRVAAERLRREVGTPFYILAENIVLAEYSALLASLEAAWSEVRVAFSVKTNPLPGLVRVLVDAGAWLETSSATEIDTLGIGASRLLYDGLYKPEWSLTRAIARHATIVIDGWSQLASVLAHCRKQEHQVAIGLRISSEMVTGHSDRFGFLPFVEDMKKIGLDICASPNVTLELIQTHLGTNQRDNSLYRRASTMLGELSEVFRDVGCPIGTLDLGGGFPANRLGETYEGLAQEIAEGLRESNVPPKTLLLVEPGRALVERAGVLVTSVVDIRHRLDGITHVVLDGGTNLAMGRTLVGDRAFVIDDHASDSLTYSIGGPLCIQDDIFAERVALPELHMGDLMIVSGVGAYDMSTAYPFSGHLPRVFALRSAGNTEQWR